MSQVLRAVVGATMQEPLALTDRNGAPINLTGAVITWLAKARVDDATAVLTAGSVAGTIVVDSAAGGTMHFAITAATMAAVEPGTYLWTLQVLAGGVTTRYPDGFQGGPGKLLVSRSVITP